MIARVIFRLICGSAAPLLSIVAVTNLLHAEPKLNPPPSEQYIEKLRKKNQQALVSMPITKLPVAYFVTNENTNEKVTPGYIRPTSPPVIYLWDGASLPKTVIPGIGESGTRGLNLTILEPDNQIINYINAPVKLLSISQDRYALGLYDHFNGIFYKLGNDHFDSSNLPEGLTIDDDMVSPKFLRETVPVSSAAYRRPKYKLSNADRQQQPTTSEGIAKKRQIQQEAEPSTKLTTSFPWMFVIIGIILLAVIAVVGFKVSRKSS
jgi:hypothetical protein